MDKPIYWVQYSLTWTKETPCIMNGNSRAESRVDFSQEQLDWLRANVKNIPLVTNPKDFQYKFTGSKYKETSNLSTTELAKLIRSEINAKFPKKKWYNISVRSEYFAWWSAIEVEIKATPFDWLTPEYKQALQTQDWDLFRRREDTRAYWQQTRYTTELCLFKDTLKNIQNQYNFDDSDSMTDYFHVNYYGGVTVSYDYNKPLSSNKSI
jgi:hypothetical protein